MRKFGKLEEETTSRFVDDPEEEEFVEEDFEEEDPEEIYGLQKPRKTWSKKELDPMENARRYELLSKLPNEAGNMLDYTTDTLEDTAAIMNGNVDKSDTRNYPIELFRKNRRGV